MDYDQQQEVISILSDVRQYVQQAYDKAELKHDHYGPDYMADALYEIMKDANILLARIDKAVNDFSN